MEHHHHTESEHGKHALGHSHTEHHHHMLHDFVIRLWVSVILTIPILLLSPMIQMFFHFKLGFTGDAYLSFVLATALFLYGGWPFLTGLISECKAKNPGMMTLIGIAITVAYIYSSAITFGIAGTSFFWELATLIDIMLLGHWLEMQSVLRASRAVAALEQMLPQIAHLKQNDTFIDIPLEKLAVNDVVLVKPGEKIPADGVVITGSSYVNESLLTGESIPREKIAKDKVIGGALNQDGSLEIQVQHLGEDSFLAKVIHLVKDAQHSKSKTQSLADRAARWLTLIALSVGIITLISWLIVDRNLGFAIERMVTVMVISCPHALGLAIPLVVAISTALAAQHGLLIRDRTAFENSRKISAIIFDKTGTLTTGIFGVVNIRSLLPEVSNLEILKLAAAVEQHSEHHLGKSIVTKASAEHLVLPTITNFNSLPGQGVTATINQQEIKVVGPHYLTANNITYSEKILNHVAATNVFVLINEQLAGIITLSDNIRNGVKDTIKQFQKKGIKVLMATGDNKNIAASIAEHLGVDDFYAEILPQQKLAIVKTLQKQGEFVAMAGDGVNDAPALAQADVGIAIGSGTDIAAETADIILASNDPKDILALINFGKKTYTKMMQNLGWALGYNIIAIPFAAGAFSYFGIILNPAVGAVLMSLSTVIVAINAAMLKIKT